MPTWTLFPVKLMLILVVRRKAVWNHWEYDFVIPEKCVQLFAGEIQTQWVFIVK